MKNISFLSENFQYLEVKFSIYLNRHVFVMFRTYEDSEGPYQPAHLHNLIWTFSVHLQNH